MNKNSNAEIIEKLEELEQLLDENLSLEDYIENQCPLEYFNKAKKHILGAESLESRPEVFNHLPIFPPDPSKMLESEKNYKSKQGILTIIAVATVVSLVLFYTTFEELWNTIAAAGILISILGVIVQNSKKKTYLKDKKEYDNALEKSNASVAAFRKALAVYDEQKETGIEAAKQFQAKYVKEYAKYEKVMEEYVDRKSASIDQYVNNAEKLKTYDFIPDDYYHLIRPIITALKSGRADDYKEALNLAIQEEREERAEAARRAEEARRTQILREQAEEERRRTREMERHNREMEQQQQMQQKLMMEEQKRLAEEQKPKTSSSHPFTWQLDKELVPGVGYRDKNGNYYNYSGIPIPPPVNVVKK